MNARFNSGFNRLSLALVGLCFLPGAAFGQTLSASADGFGGLFLEPMSVTADSNRVDDSNPACSPCITTITDTVTIVGGLWCSASPPIFDVITSNLFSWFSATTLPGNTLFPKTFSGVTGPLPPISTSGTNVWQTTSPVLVSPGIVRMQNVWFRPPGGVCDLDQTIGCIDDDDCKVRVGAAALCVAFQFCINLDRFGPVNSLNALAWSADLSGGVVAGVQAIESLSLVSSSTLADGAGSEVRLESVVSEGRPGAYRYDYIFENFSSGTVTIMWDSANLTRTLEPFEVLTVTELYGSAARESQGYAHVVNLDGEPVAELVSMALVPVQSSPPPPFERARVETKSDRNLNRGDRR